MSKFNKLYNTYFSDVRNINEADDTPNLINKPPTNNPNQETKNTGPDSIQPQTPAPEEVKEPTQDLTSEGKKFLIELALKALSVNPENITTTDKDIFDTEVTAENADSILQRLRSIVDVYS